MPLLGADVSKCYALASHTETHLTAIVLENSDQSKLTTVFSFTSTSTGVLWVSNVKGMKTITFSNSVAIVSEHS